MLDLISSEYLEEQKRLHLLGGYGERGDRWVTPIIYLKGYLKAQSILDYGCGAGALAKALSWYYLAAEEYDPAIEEKSNLPEPCDLVICTDVLEHIEPDLLDNVLEHLHSLTKVALFAVISTRPAGKLLSDGSNAHLIVKPGLWWRARVDRQFSVKAVWKFEKDEWVALMYPRRLT